jgi:hypothetical protein
LKDGMALAPYTGLVATNCKNCSTADPVNNFWMGRSLHTASDNISSLQLVYANWFLTHTPSVADQGGGTTATYTAAIEYPVGVFTQVKFAGSVSGTAASGATLTSDAVAVTIPQGKNFYVRTYRVHAAGSFNAPFNGFGSTLNQALGDTCAIGTTSAVADQTMGGTIVNSGGASGYAMITPTAIIGTTTRATYFVIGDSRVDGGGPLIVGQNTVTNPCVGEIGPSFFNNDVGFMVSAIGMDIASNWSTGLYTLSPALAAYCSDVISNHSINDFTLGSTAAQLIAMQQTIRGRFSGKRYWTCTVAPDTASTDDWRTLVNQTIFAQDPARQAYNKAVRAGLPGMYGFIDIAMRVETQPNTGFWLVNGDGHYMTADGVHESTRATALISSTPMGIPLSVGNLGGNGGLIGIGL